MRGRIALVTGGTSGIGLAAAHGFAREGATVIITGRSEKRAEEALKSLDKDASVSWIACDSGDGKSVARLVETIQQRHGRLDYAFNNGGSMGNDDIAPIATMSEESWRRTIDGYLTSVFLCMRYQLPPMLAAKRGVIVNMSSIYGLRGHSIPGGGAYAAAKHGVLGLTNSAARHYAATGVRITAVCPGWVETPPIAEWMEGDPKFAAALTSMTPRGRIAAPDEIANAVLWLCSDAASYMIGPLVVDGGYMT